MGLRLTDSHAHLGSLAERGIALADILSGWAAAGGGLLLDAGTEPGDLSARRAAVEAAAASLSERGISFDPSTVRYSAGAWPSPGVVLNPEASLAGMDADIAAGACAVGECGLDYHYLDVGKDEQRAFFASCCRLAAGRGLPLIVHSRDAFPDTFEILKREATGARIVIHCFSYDAEAARAFLDLGAWISFAGSLSFKNAPALREAALLVPADRLLAETDSPYLAPVPHRGKDCRPEMVERTISLLSTLRDESPARLAATVEANFEALFLP